ncbi:F-box protein SKIP24 [Euphorbia lathyris]|uniref:F-box protein SKIP24 n=1 Tax=Euphorbia lathyris TaxID=212925 RepID=UPI0033139453
MSDLPLPDELWRQILEFGIGNSKFTYKDLCSVSISCKRLHLLSGEDSLWSHLISSDFPPTPQHQNPNNANHHRSTLSSAKSIYKIRFEREKERMRAAHRRVVFRKESEIMERDRKIRAMETRLLKENERMRDTSTELSNLQKVRQASVALKVWQPHLVRSRQKQIVEQNVVSVESRVNSLEMDLKLSKQQIAGLTQAYRNEKQMRKRALEELESMKYHPLRDYKECNKKRNKLKTNENRKAFSC